MIVGAAMLAQDASICGGGHVQRQTLPQRPRVCEAEAWLEEIPYGNDSRSRDDWGDTRAAQLLQKTLDEEP
jgi:hypothetical protein